ncbi:MAG: glycosyltransferase family 39 protein, partial [Elusimicrobiota bacterium]
MTGYDEYAYAHISHNIAKSNFILAEINSYYGFRWLVNLPVALGYEIFGVNIISTSYFPFLCSIGNIILAFFFGKYLYNYKIGLIAALFQAVFPVHVIYGTILYPEEIIYFFTNISILLVFSK